MAVKDNLNKVGGGKTDVTIQCVTSDYQYVNIKTKKNPLYVQYISGNTTSIIIYGRNDYNGIGGTVISNFTLSPNTEKQLINFGDYEYISIKHTTTSGSSMYRIFEE